MADITLSELTNGSISQNSDEDYVWTGTGAFDKLISAVNSNIKIQYDNGAIDKSDYAQVYLAAIQTTIQTAVDFLLREQLVEAQIAQTETQTAVENYRLTNVLPKEVEKLEEEIDYLQTQDNELQLNGAKERELQNEQINKAKAQVVSEEKNQIVKQKQADLIERQRLAYDDNLRVEEAKIRKDVVFGALLGGQSTDNYQLIDMYAAIDAIG